MNEESKALNYRRAFLITLVALILVVAAAGWLGWNSSFNPIRRVQSATSGGNNLSQTPTQGTELASDPSTPPSDTELATIQLSPQRLQSIGVKIGTVESKSINDEIRFYGNVQPNERRFAYVQTRFAGWIRQVATPSGSQIPIEEVAAISFSRGPAMIRDEDGQLTGYVYVDLNTNDYGGFVQQASNLLQQRLRLPAGYTYQWSGEYEFELRARQRLKIILPIVFFVIFMLLYMVFHSVAEATVLIFPTLYAMTGGLVLQWLLKYNFSVAVWVGYIALFGIAVETGVVMVVYLHEALNRRLATGNPLRHEDIEAAVIEGAVQRLRPKLMTVCAVLASLIPILWEWANQQKSVHLPASSAGRSSSCSTQRQKRAINLTTRRGPRSSLARK